MSMRDGLMSKTEKLLEILTSERYVSREEARDLLRHFYHGMNQVIEEMEMKRDAMFEMWAMEEDRKCEY